MRSAGSWAGLRRVHVQAIACITLQGVTACRQLLVIDDPEVVELGADCTGPGGAGDPTRCPASAPICASVTGTTDFCTASCGTGPAGSGDLVPPADGDAICSLRVTSGTPACVFPVDQMNGVVTWYCGILCGVSETTDLGPCPSPLSCIENICR